MPAVIEARRTGRPPRIAARTAGIALTVRLPTIVDIPRHVHIVLRRVATPLHAATVVAVAITLAAVAEAPIVEAEVVAASTAVEVAGMVVEVAVTINPIS